MIPIFKPTPGDDELNEIKDSFQSHWIGLGPKTKEFENKFSNYIGCKNAVALNSCTSALHLALHVLGIKSGDEVLISSMTFASTGHAVIFTGATPILVDVNSETLQMDVNDLKRKITPKTKAIIPVHYGGHICDMDEIIQVARERGLYIIEDAANCTGASYKGKKIGNLQSDFTCFSFEAKKNMTTGDGGMITTNKEGEIIERLHKIKWVGMDKDTLKRFSGSSKPWEYDISELGFKYNMNDIAASIGLHQLNKLDDMNNKRRNIVLKYNEAFKNLSWIKKMPIREDRHETHWLYILRLNEGNRDDMMKHLFDNGVFANTSSCPLHLFTYYKKYYEEKGINVNCPIAEREWNKLFVIPLFPDMTPEEIDKVISVVKSFKENFGSEEKTGIEGLFTLSPKIYGDERGYFFESYNEEKFRELGIPNKFVQDNQSLSKKGVLRGLHFQKYPHGQGKLIRVVKGRILDVAVDLRKNSPTYKKYFSVELSEENKKMFWIPEGFAHGFLTLEDDTILQYKCTTSYNPEFESGIIWDDSDLEIDWKFREYGINEVIVSEKDKKLPKLREIENNL